MSRYLSTMLQSPRLNAMVLSSISIALMIGIGIISPPSNADTVHLAESTKDMFVGEESAPLTIVEYASLGCSHCANFHHESYPQLKTDFIETGKVKLIFRDFPLGTPALAAAMIARCSGEKRYFGFLDILFRSQSQWSRAENPLEALTMIARFGGMQATDVKKCVQNQKLLEYIQAQKKRAYDQDGIDSTPYFKIGTQSVAGSIPYDQFKKIVEAELKKLE